MVDRRDIYHHCSCSYQIDCCIAHRDTETFRLGALKLHAIVFGSLSILTREEIGFLRMESLTSKQTWTSTIFQSFFSVTSCSPKPYFLFIFHTCRCNCTLPPIFQKIMPPSLILTTAKCQD